MFARGYLQTSSEHLQILAEERAARGLLMDPKDWGRNSTWNRREDEAVGMFQEFSMGLAVGI
jgi:hypothetical protein